MSFSAATATALSTLTHRTRRDRQRRVGPSELGDPCQRCLAEKLIGAHEDERQGTPLAPFLGTAFHAYADSLSHAYEEGDRGNGLVLTECLVEVGEAGGYGTVTGSMDRFDVREGHGIDWKILSKRRIRDMSRAFDPNGEWWDFSQATSNAASTLTKYLLQLTLYGRGMERAGYEVNRLSLVMLPRDATIDTIEDAATELEIEYRPDVAERVLARAGAIFEWASQNPERVDLLPSDPYCYYCKYNRNHN